MEVEVEIKTRNEEEIQFAVHGPVHREPGDEGEQKVDAGQNITRIFHVAVLPLSKPPDGFVFRSMCNIKVTFVHLFFSPSNHSGQV